MRLSGDGDRFSAQGDGDKAHKRRRGQSNGDGDRFKRTNGGGDRFENLSPKRTNEAGT